VTADKAVVEAYAKAWLGGNAAEIIAFYHDDFALHYFGQSPMAGDHVGKTAAVVALARVQQMVNRKLLGIEDVMGGSEYVSMISKEQWQRDGETLELRRLLLFKTRDDKLSECWLYDEDQRAVDEFWS
jgi:hypothetical protein